MNIKILQNDIINKMAAGEVIERPASVVKELVENAIDAKATSISIHIKDGGKTYIEVIDNGIGIKNAEVETAFVRNATSKLSNIDDLDNMVTLGFRGEALSSISSISELTVLTKTKDEKVGIKLEIVGGKITKNECFAMVDGTSFVVKNLFFNTPTRYGFLKKDSIEANAIKEIIYRLALANPNISFKYVNNEVEILKTLGDNNLKNCIFYIYGKDIAKKLVEINCTKDGYKLCGFIALPETARSTKSYEMFFVHNRYIKNKLLTSAVENAYEDKLMISRFPAFVLNLISPEKTVDVNVNATKINARFSDETFLYNFIFTSIKNALCQEVLIPNITLEKNIPVIKNAITSSSVSFESQNKIESLLLQEKEDNKNSSKYGAKPPVNKEDFNYSKNVIKNNNLVREAPFIQAPVSYNNNNVNASNISKELIYPKIIEQQNLQDNLSSTTCPKKHTFFNNYSIIGQIFGTYWIVEDDKEIYLIDQHSAHEKIIYEKLKREFKEEKVVSQKMIQPITITVSPEEKCIIDENIDTFCKFGFGIEEFGSNAYVIREVPFIFNKSLEPNFFMELISIFSKKNITNLYEAKTDKIISMSCKKAVKANNKLSDIEAKNIITGLLELETPFTCPHGRPTIIKLTKYEIEKLFKRIQN